MQLQNKLVDILHKFISLIFSKVIVLKVACSEPFQERRFLGNLQTFRRLFQFWFFSN